MANELGELSDYMGPRKLDANIVVSKDLKFACVKIERKEYDDDVSLKFSFQNSGKDFYLGMNKTNLNILDEYMQDEKMKQILELVGCVFTFDQVQVRNPQTGKNMQSLVIDKIER